MRTKILLGLVVLATMSCTNEPVSGPTKTVSPNFAKGGGGGSTCDPQKEVCTLDGRMTGGGGTVTIGDVLITKGLTVHCDILLSNNLEINWPGHKWHLDKPLTSAQCIDDPDVNPEPPPAPFDTFIGEGIGQLDGVDGSLVKFTFVDAGEPGGKNDRAAIQIFDAGNNLVLDLPLGFTSTGNLQAHYDQPHK